MGCAECYKVFSEGLETLLKTMHKGTRHVGKVPQVFRQNQDLTDKLKGLQKKLEKAKRYFDHLIWAQVILDVEKNRHIAEIVIHETPSARCVFRGEF